MGSAIQRYGQLYLSDGSSAGYERYYSHTWSDTDHRAKPHPLTPTRRRHEELDSVRTLHTFSVGPYPDQAVYDAASVSGFPNSSMIDSLHQRALLSLLEKIKDEYVNLPMVVAEYGQTCNLFYDLAIDVYLLSKKLKRGDFKDAYLYLKDQSPTKTAANRWLQATYGVIPLMSDLDGACRGLADTLYNVSQRRRRTAKAEDTDDVQFQRLLKEGHWDDSKWYIHGSHTAKYSVKYMAKFDVSFNGAESARRLGFTNPLSVAWEVVPFSFVVDWLFPVGSWLNSLDALVGVTNLEVTSTVRASSSTEYGVGQLARCSQKLYERDIVENFHPRLVYSPSDSLQKVINGMALLRQIR